MIYLIIAQGIWWALGLSFVYWLFVPIEKEETFVIPPERDVSPNFNGGVLWH